MTNNQEPPKIEFPCSYLIKVIGDSAHDFPALVCDIMKKHDADFDGKHSIRNSGKGRFVSINVTITAQGEQHLENIHKDLKATGRVKMVI
ncbi:hypothetical protein SIN8267_02558 [Sinobacterium norvegicum]|uniref:UPF0250 protein SIN8267_02558 n=1 Tax=Sinobacterium norvegicum TaxID=1641715 RepID=A0ABM9AI57_9GAMM|nr:DUF493 domain-containing protein [Sinobacterium norvegicum]CAH0992438.1 hypothetical protein SIN8267_02558 [Sinobacterium norvegicum]